MLMISLGANQLNGHKRVRVMREKIWRKCSFLVPFYLKIFKIIGVGRGPSGPSIKGAFCHAFYFCCALRDGRIKKKREKLKK